MRIRWRRVARVAAIIVVGLIALRVVPGLLRAPEPPPLGADVGLPKAKTAPAEPVRAVTKEPARRRGKAAPSRDVRKSRRKQPAPVVTDAPAATAVIGSRQRNRDRRPRGRPPHRRRRGDSAPAPPESPAEAASAPVESSPPPAPEYVPPPVAEPSPAPVPEPAPEPPSTPGDGSEEFAPH